MNFCLQGSPVRVEAINLEQAGISGESSSQSPMPWRISQGDSVPALGTFLARSRPEFLSEAVASLPGDLSDAAALVK